MKAPHAHDVFARVVPALQPRQRVELPLHAALSSANTRRTEPRVDLFNAQPLDDELAVSVPSQEDGPSAATAKLALCGKVVSTPAKELVWKGNGRVAHDVGYHGVGPRQ